MRKLITIISLICTLLLISSCSIENNEEASLEENVSILVNNKTQNEVIDIIGDAIIGIYMPSSQDGITEAINRLAPISTEKVLIDMIVSAGEFDGDKIAKVKNLKVNIASPSNTENKLMKYLVTFSLELDDVHQNILIEFKCDEENMISAYSIWVNNV